MPKIVPLPPFAKNPLSLALKEATADIGSLEEALRVALAQVCAHTGWKAGRIEFSSEVGELSSRIVWHLAGPEQLDNFRKLAEARRHKGNDGPAAQVLRGGQAVFSLATVDEMRRGAGPAASFAFPVHVMDRTLAALEFFSDRPAVPDKALVAGIIDAVAELAATLTRKPAEDELWGSLGYREIFESTGEALLVVDPTTGRVVEANRSACAVYLLPHEALVGTRLDTLWQGGEVANPGAQRGRFEVPHRRAGKSDLILEITTSDVLYRGQRALLVISRQLDGAVPRQIDAMHESEIRDVELSSHELSFEGHEAMLVSASDVTARRKAQARLLHAAFYDPLTALPNRALFRDRLELAFARARGREQVRFAVLFLDIDRFKVVNDGLGHRAGDELLIQIGRRLEACRRTGDTVARLGGDEFTMLVEGITDERDAVAVAERVHGAMAAPFLVESHELYASLSIGIALGGPATEASEHSLRDADTAMYRAKLRGSRHAVFDASMHERATAALRMENELRRALDRGELRVHYQPIVDLATGELRGLEALVRWQHPERGMIEPGAFIPLAEVTGLIVPVGRWVLEQACLQARALPSPAMLSVNLSGRQLMQPELIDQVKRALSQSGLDPRRLRLELTESMLIESGAAAMDRLEELRKLEVSLCIDDFGTGYSSLSYLHQLPIDALKIDLSFIKAMVTDQRKIKIVESILLLGKGLGIEVVAEGVETLEQAALLRSLGCQRAQGYLFARPLPFEELSFTPACS
jgi:diguanylate cyclase (GGDEF)-like protein